MNRESDKVLLRRFEPVLRYSKHERFFPIDVGSYVRDCSLWVAYPGREPELLAPKGELTLERLVEFRPQGIHSLQYLKFIEPMSPAQMATYRLKQVREELTEGRRRKRFRAETGRLARVGYVSRLVDAVFSITLLARGRVTGDTAVAAGFAYDRLVEEGARHVYYGRVVRQNGWIVLQYWFFYAFNDWRSGFYGANDHEADWESICIYLWESETGELKPEWIACTAHDETGDDLRRRWDDPGLEKIGEHPVIYAAAGSHANYFRSGEYLAELKLTFLAPLGRMLERARKLPQSILGKMQDRPSRQPKEFFIRVPFIDYAAADGAAIGLGQSKEWCDLCLLDPVPPWAFLYRGLWGHYARDPASGEDAPAGPLYNRNGTMRLSWYDPVGWAGLNKVLPPGNEVERSREAITRAKSVNETLRKHATQERDTLVNLSIEARAVQAHPHLKSAYMDRQARIKEESKNLAEIHGQIASNEAMLEALDMHLKDLEAGERPSPRAHLRRPHLPASDVDLRLSRLAETWAAISIGLALMGVVALMLFAREHLREGLAALAFTLVAVEAGFRRRLQRLIAGVSVALAVASALIILYEFLWEILLLGVLLVGGHLLVQNLRELWRR
jgi:hypothetical protein